MTNYGNNHPSQVMNVLTLSKFRFSEGERVKIKSKKEIKKYLKQETEPIQYSYDFSYMEQYCETVQTIETRFEVIPDKYGYYLNNIENIIFLSWMFESVAEGTKEAISEIMK